jgi:hypothetical protein
MAALSSIKRILSESFPEVKWIDRLLGPLNQFIEEVNRALNNQLTVAANMDGVVRTVEIDGTFPVKFKWPRAARPTAAWIVNVQRVGGGDVVQHAYDDVAAVERDAAISLLWEFDGNGNFVVNAVPGLAASGAAKHTITIIALAG